MYYHISRDEMLAILRRAGHPDLSVPESMRTAIPGNAFTAPYLQSIADYADSCRGTAIPVLSYSDFRKFYDTGDRGTYEDSARGYFPRRGRLACFAVMAWLYGRDEDIAELEDIIWAVCDEYTWALPAHLPRTDESNSFTRRTEHGKYTVDLFAAETADALAEIAFLMEDRLHEIVRSRISQLLEERVFSRVLAEDFPWMHYTSNWASVCAGSVGMAAIYAIRDESHLADVLSRLMPAMENFLSGFAADGSCLEGIGYWNYGFSYFVSFAELLQRRTAGAIDLMEDETVRRIAAFQQKCYFPGGRTVSFSDGSSRTFYQIGLTSYLSRRYPDVILPPAACSQQEVSDDHCFRWSNVLRNLLWAADAPDEDAAQAKCYILPAAQWYLGTGSRGVSIAAKGGHNDEPHNHNDIGSFQVFMNGEEILSDLGSGEYTRQYFSDMRYTIFPCGSQGHSVPMIDECTQRTGRAACAENIAINEGGISMDITAAYDIPSLLRLHRALSFDRDAGRITVDDTFVFDGGTHRVTERFITGGIPAAEPGRITIRVGKECMTLTYDPAIWTADFVPTSYANHKGETVPLYAVDLCASAGNTLRAMIQIEPAAE